MNQELKLAIQEQLIQSQKHLIYSFEKVKKINLEQLDEENDEKLLETLESFSSRLARYSDLLISKYFKLLILEKDPAFRGSIIDVIHQSEKYEWIESSEIFKRVRELKNPAAYDYSLGNYAEIYKELIYLCPYCLKVSIDL